jgi:hypothetical protein
MKGQQTLPRELRNRAERFFGVSFSDLEVHVDPRVASIGARAFAYGRRIHLAPHCADFEVPENRLLLGHELAHVVQQGQGRVRPTAYLAGLPLNDDPHLEAEAEEMGRRFVAGAPPLGRFRRLPLAPPKAWPEAVLQRTVLLGGYVLSSWDQLPEKVRQVLVLIEGGREWLDWAIVEPREIFQFPGYEALVEGVQAGLHNAFLMLLTRLGLLVGPGKLFRLPENVLTAIYEWELDGGTSSQKKVLQNILQRYGLWTQSELAAASHFLVDHGVDGASVFQVLSLQDQISFLHLLNDPDTPLGRVPNELTTEATKFGVRHADNPEEVIDYLLFFLATVEKLGFETTTKGGVSKDEKKRLWNRAQGILEELRRHVPDLLRSLVFPEVPSPEELELGLASWIGLGNVLGFRRLSAAVSQVYQYSDLRQQTGAEMRRIIDAYISRAQRFLAAHRPKPGVLLQNGASWYYEIEGAGGRAVLMLGNDDSLTLKQFIPDQHVDEGG